MPEKSGPQDFLGRFREIVSDPLNLLIVRDPEAGSVVGDHVILHNGNRVARSGPLAYYDSFSDILVINRGVHEPLEEYAFQEVLRRLPEAPVMLELGAYWGHYSMWLKKARPQAVVHLVEPSDRNLEAGRANFRLNGYDGVFVQASVGPGQFEVDRYMAEAGLDRLTVLHSDIQGAEGDMLDGAAAALDGRKVDYLFVSTHGQNKHVRVRSALEDKGYRIDFAADCDRETTSYDGFLLAVRPDLPPIDPAPPPPGREAILAATPRALVDSLVARLGPGERTG